MVPSGNRIASQPRLMKVTFYLLHILHPRAQRTINLISSSSSSLPGSMSDFQSFSFPFFYWDYSYISSPDECCKILLTSSLFITFSTLNWQHDSFLSVLWLFKCCLLLLLSSLNQRRNLVWAWLCLYHFCSPFHTNEESITKVAMLF